MHNSESFNANNHEDRKTRINALKEAHKQRTMVGSIQSVTDKLSSLNAAYSLLLPSETGYDAPLSWIEEHFTTNSSHILWDNVEHAQLYSWDNDVSLQQVLVRLTEDARLEKSEEVMIVFGNGKPHVYLVFGAVVSVICEVSELETEWWLISSSRAWILECRRYGEVWFYPFPKRTIP